MLENQHGLVIDDLGILSSVQRTKLVRRLALRGGFPAWTLIVPALLLVLAWQATRAIRVGVADRPAMTRAIEMTLGIHTIGSLWLAGCALFIAYFSA